MHEKSGSLENKGVELRFKTTTRGKRKYVSELVAALKLCTNTKDIKGGKKLHLDAIETACHTNKYVTAALISMYMKCGSIQRAQEVFDISIHRDVVTWTSLVLGYVENGESYKAMDLFTKLECEPNHVTYVAALKACARLAMERHSEKQFCLEKGIAIHGKLKDHGFDSNLAVMNTLLDMYGKCGSMQRAREVFERTTSKDVVTWNCLILGYVENGESSVALDLLSNMNCEPTSVTYVAALKACVGLVTDRESRKLYLEKGIALHKQVNARGFDSNILVVNTLLDVYGRCGSMNRARYLFEGMVLKDVVAWSCLISRYVDNEESYVALDLFMSMDCEPDHVTYAAALKACGCLAALSIGQWIHFKVCTLGLDEHQMVANALIDLYGKCGRMDVAKEFFDSMCCPDICSWTGLIAGYSLLGESSQVSVLVKKIQEVGLQMDGVTFTCVLAACRNAGLIEEGKTYFESMCKYGVAPSLEHYNCIVDMLSRGNKLEEAVTVVRNMPYKADDFTWTTLLEACRKWKNLGVGRIAFDELVSRNTKYAVAYVMMNDLYKS